MPYDENELTFPRFEVRAPTRRKRLSVGLVQVYTGGGKGKSTAGFGLIVRAVGHGLRCCLIQFMKKGNYGEIVTLQKLPGVHIEQYGSGHWVKRNQPAAEDLELATRALRQGARAAASGKYDLVVLDEVNTALVRGLVPLAGVLDLVEGKAARTELVLTGRGAPKALLDRAHLVTMMVGMKHPYHGGLDARPGIEW
jgi:cob(I)alamin adenosyltransferase